MIFPEVMPSRSDCQRQIIEALKSSGARIYVDASVLMHCYEVSRSACEELLATLEGFGDAVRVPVWSAKETWDRTRKLPSKKPLAKTAAMLTRRMEHFSAESLRYVDERTFDDMSVEQFAEAMGNAATMVDELARRADRITPEHDDANARLLPFIAAHSLRSRMELIYDEVARTGETRFTHQVPPGFGDGGTRKDDEEPEADQAEPQAKPQQKGKSRNRHGDLIMWLEALQDCESREAKHLIILTRDNSKKDWVYKPERVLGDDGTPQMNSGVVTLPLPLLVQEAKQRCATLESVHVLSLEWFTQVARTSFGARVSNLVRALQANARPARPRRRPGARLEPSAESIEELAAISFSSADMMYERPADDDDPVWWNIEGLRSEGWTAQNEAAATLIELTPAASSEQLKQIGRGIVAASNEDAVGPVELANSILGNRELPATIRGNLLVGLLAETYFDENGEPKKPAAVPDVSEALFDHAGDEDTRRAYAVTIERLAPNRRLYLALPGEAERTIRLEIQVNQSALQSVQADGVELLEEKAPESRRLLAGARAGSLSVNELIAAIAREFVVPARMLEVDGPTNFQFEIPDRMGFINWGPATGEVLR